MQNRLGLRYTTLLINLHRQTHGENSVSRYTVDLAFRRLQPKITKNQKIQQGTNNEGKRKEAKYQQVKQCLIVLNRLSVLTTDRKSVVSTDISISVLTT